MKKKLIIAVIAIILISATMIGLCACEVTNFVTKNNQRDYAQVAATVTYNGRVKNILKSDISQMFTSTGYIYMSYYGYTADAVFEMLSQSMSNTALYNLYIIDEYNKELTAKGITLQHSTVGNKAPTDLQRAKEIEEILYYIDSVELRDAIDTTNTTFETAFDDELAEIIEDRKLAATVTDDTRTEQTKGEEPTGKLKSISITAKGSCYTVQLDENGDAPDNLLCYFVGDSIDENDIIITGTYAAQGDETVTWEIDFDDCTASGFSSTAEATAQKVTLTYGKKSADFYINIVAKETPRTSKPAEEEETESTYKPEDTEDKSYSEYVETLDNSKYFNKIDTSSFGKDENDALSNIRKALEDSYRTYEYYLLSNYETSIGTVYENKLLSAYTNEQIRELVIERYKELLLANIETYEQSEDNYKAALEEDLSQVVNYKESGYYYVKHILLSFTDEQTALVEAFEDLGIASEEELLEYRNSLINDILVNVSNPDYDAEATCEGCPCKACSNYKGDEAGECTLDECVCPDCENNAVTSGEGTCYGCPCIDCDNHKLAVDDNGKSISEGHVCKVADCPCVLCENNIYSERDVAWTAIYDRIKADFLAAITNDMSEAEKVRALNKVIDDWTYLVNDDTGSFEKINANYPGYLMTPVGVSSGMVAEFEELCEELYTDFAGGALASELIKEARYCVTDYGIHIIFFLTEAINTDIAVDASSVDEALESGNLVNKVEGIDGYIIGLDYVVDFNDGETLGEILTETVKTELAADLTIGSKKAFYTDNYAGSIQIFAKVYADLIEQADAAYGQS